MKKDLVCYMFSFSTMFLIVVGLLICGVMPVFSATDSKIKTDICVVFDNSASTYMDETWCRYKYALEILAALIDYDNGGQLTIYPLCDVTIDGRNSSASCEPIKIKSYTDISKITNMYTVTPGGTSFVQVEKAYYYLANNSSAEDKRLFILTDGEFDFSYSNEKDLKKNLLRMTDNGTIKIHYFGSGSTVEVAPDESKGLYSYSMKGLVDSKQILDFVVSFCCEAFNQTMALSSDSQSTKIFLSADSKVIVFANGKGSSILGLTDGDNIAVPFLYDTGRHKYSTTKAEGYVDAPVDTSLESYISVFACNSAGEYLLDCDNSDYVNIYVQQNNNDDVSKETETKDTDITINSSAEINDDGNDKTNVKYIIIICGVMIGAVVCIFSLEKNKKRKQKTDSKIKDDQDSGVKHNENKTNYVFISYSSKDKNIADNLCSKLESRGMRVWYAPRDVVGPYAESIFDAINRSSYFVIILSENSMKSQHVLNEIDLAFQRLPNNIKFKPLRIDDTMFTASMNYYLSRQHWLDAIDPPIEDRLNEFVDSILEDK